jgi:transcriptional regulator with XRE-family HTH domain
MKERILEFLRKENKTSAQFAEEIGVQPSGISHIISGRNNPSLDFVLKMLEKYSFLSAEWLLFGKGSIYKEPKMADLFSSLDMIEAEKPKNDHIVQKDKGLTDSRQDSVKKIQAVKMPENEAVNIIKIVWFYENGSFEEFCPRKN